MEKKRIIKDGQIIVKNPLYQELPKREVNIKPGRTSCRFTGSHDGERNLPHNVKIWRSSRISDFLLGED